MNIFKSSFMVAMLAAGSSLVQAAPVAAPLGLFSINPDVATFSIDYDYIFGNAGTVDYDGGTVTRNVGTFSVNVGLADDFFVNGNDDYVGPVTGNNQLQIQNGEYSFSALIDEAGVFVSGGEIKLSGRTFDGVTLDPFRDLLVGTIDNFGYNGGAGTSGSPAVFEFTVDVFSSPDSRISYGSEAGVIMGESNNSGSPIDFTQSFGGTTDADTFRVAVVPTPDMVFLMIGGLVALVTARRMMVK